MILSQVKEIKNISMPGLKVDGECTRPLVAALVNITSCRIVCTEHGYDTIGVAISSGNV